MVPLRATLDFTGITAVTRLRRAALWTLNRVALAPHIRRMALAFVRIFFTRTVVAWGQAKLDYLARSFEHIKTRDVDFIGPPIVAIT